jgi:uncharacterized protein YgiM (DUF1202 family)
MATGKSPFPFLLSKLLLSSLITGTLFFSLSVTTAQAQTRDRLCETAFRLLGNSEANEINIWSSPNNDSDLVKTLPSGTEVLFNLHAGRGDWSEITLPGGATGWVADRFLLPSPAGASQFHGTMQVRTLDGGGAVNLHALDSGYIMDGLPDGAIVTYNESVGYFHNVTTSAGVRGRIFNIFLVCN